MFNIEMAKYLPELEWGKIEVKKVKSYKADSADYQIKIGVKNNGKLPTALRQAQLVKIVREDRIELEFDTAGYAKGKPDFRVIEEKKASPGRTGRGISDEIERQEQLVRTSKNIPFTQGGSSTDAVFTIRLYKRHGAQMQSKYVLHARRYSERQRIYNKVNKC